jgi:hypothetical protein
MTEWLVASHESQPLHYSHTASPVQARNPPGGIRLTSFEVDDSLITSPVPPGGDWVVSEWSTRLSYHTCQATKSRPLTPCPICGRRLTSSAKLLTEDDRPAPAVTGWGPCLRLTENGRPGPVARGGGLTGVRTFCLVRRALLTSPLRPTAHAKLNHHPLLALAPYARGARASLPLAEARLAKHDSG